MGFSERIDITLNRIELNWAASSNKKTKGYHHILDTCFRDE